MFFLFVGNTDIAKIPGLSAAGANIDLLPFTAPADADVIRFGHPRSIDVFPLDPEGHPTPAIVTRAAALAADIPVCVVRSGSYTPPAPPYIELGAQAGGDPRTAPSVPDIKKIFDSAGYIAQNFTNGANRVMLAETVPGGTTTALLVLRALGHDCMVSSAGPVNPIQMKEQVWSAASARAGIGIGGFKADPFRAITEFGDAMQAAILSFAMNSGKRTQIVLAGGTQMLAIAACFRAAGYTRDITVATTKYVTNDKSSSFSELAEKLGVDVYSAQLDFSDSPHKGMRDYEAGFIKEGVGAGGSVLYASWLGVGIKEVIAKTNELYDEITGPFAKR